MNAPWNNEDLRRAFDADFEALVSFASRSKARVGFAFLRADGHVDLGRPLDARISARMTHVFALAQMRGIEGAAHLVDHGLAALTGPLRGPGGSWYSEVVPTSETSATPVPRSVLSQRAQSAMIGAAAAALMAGHAEAGTLLADLETDQDRRWWDPNVGAVREEIDPATGARSPLRRLSTNLDTAQSYLAAWEATGNRVWFDRARSIMRLVGEIAARSGFALPDLFDEEWRPLPPTSDQPPLELIRPADTLPGLGFKAARLIGQIHAILTHMGETPGPWILDTAVSLYECAHADGWTDDGVGGIVYTLQRRPRPRRTGRPRPPRGHGRRLRPRSRLGRLPRPRRRRTLDPRNRARRIRLHAGVGGTPGRPDRRPHARPRRRPHLPDCHRGHRSGRGLQGPARRLTPGPARLVTCLPRAPP